MDKEDIKKIRKEQMAMLHELLKIKPLGASLLISEVEDTIVNSIDSGRKRMKKLMGAIDQEYPNGTVKRGYVDGMSYFLFRNAFELYFIGNNAALFVELQGLLERLCVDEACKYIAVNDTALKVLQDSYRKKVLTDIAPYFKTISMWDDEDVKFANKLTQIRNGIAHKNATLVNRQLGNGADACIGEITTIVNKTEVVPYILRVIDLCLKVSGLLTPGKVNNPRFEARLKAYSSIAGQMLNLHGELLLQGYPSVVRVVILNNMYANVLMLSTEKTRSLLNDYKAMVIEFQDVLNVDDDKANKLHEKLTTLIDQIFKSMNKDLNIDADVDFFVKDSLETMKKSKEYLEKEFAKQKKE